MSRSARVLVVAHKTAATPALLDAVRERAAEGDATFTLLVPKPTHGLDRLAAASEDHGQEEGEQVLALALPLLEEAVGSTVEGKVGSSSPIEAIADAVNTDGYDEVIISTLPHRVSRWLHLDLPRKVAAMGVKVTTVSAKERTGMPA
jgi:xanthine/CO dehydrogenase XdhC/CoxF family maturation factor